jgi:hypothetical protein
MSENAERPASSRPQIRKEGAADRFARVDPGSRQLLMIRGSGKAPLGIRESGK